MDQNTLEWKKWRHSKIGASDAPVVMGVSKYKKRHELLKEKQTKFEDLEEKDYGPVAALGHVIEDMERPRFQILMGEDFLPTLLESKENPFISASFDGLNLAQIKAWEHKVVGQKMFDEIKSGVVPPQYYPQLQQQFYVCDGLEEIHFCAVLYKKEMLKEKLKPEEFQRAKIIVKRDEKYIKKLVKENKKFWDEVKKGINFKHLNPKARKLTRLKALIKKLQDSEKSLKEEITKEVETFGGAMTNQYKISLSQRVGKTSYDFEKMLKDEIDLKKYEKQGKPFSVLSVKEIKK